ncbi:MAG: glucose 1-dehydrogenase [Pseudomonadota bacterium]
MGRLKGKKAFITGGAQGMGACFARMFADEGASVAVTDINGEGAKTTAELINEKHPGAAISFSHDVTSEGQWKEALTGTKDAFGGMNILVNNAGVGTAGSIGTETIANYQKVQDINTASIFTGTQLSLPYLTESMPSSIINIASVASFVANRDSLSYNVSKAGVVMMSKSIALHCTKHKLDIRSNSICPAFTRTPILEAMLEWTGNAEHWEQKMVKAAPIGRLAEPEDVGYAAIYLASDESRFVTGTEIRVDGGMTA